MTQPKQKPRYVQQKVNCNPEQGLAALLAVTAAPEGYKFLRMKRRMDKATITYIREDLLEVPNDN